MWGSGFRPPHISALELKFGDAYNAGAKLSCPSIFGGERRLTENHGNWDYEDVLHAILCLGSVHRHVPSNPEHP